MILDLRNLPDVPTNKLNSDVCIRLSYLRSRLQHYFQKLLFLLHRILTPYYFFLFTFFFLDNLVGLGIKKVTMGL